ncbi:MAG: MMPL family transporter [Verrucomicrobia bacterium]|nr:MMPL family transporter [Verrucomicrobiota bacterium]MCH8527052.1 MMPL family transporter [Kiritimatiellia bacterium]
MKLFLTKLGLRFPIPVMLIVLAVTAVLTVQFPKVNFDNNPENMLEYDEPVRVIHRDVKARFDLYDFVVVGIVNYDHPGGVWNPETLARVHTLTHELVSLHQTEAGRPAVTRNGDSFTPELNPTGWWANVLAAAFRQDGERLFTEEGESGLITREILAPSVVDTIRQLEMGALDIRFLMEEPPATQEEADALFHEAWNNPLYRDTLLSEDRNALGVYLPILGKEFSYNISKLVEALTADWPEEDVIYITGLPVAEDTFGHEMLIQMATSAPMAGLMIFLLLLFFFRRLSLIIAPMIIAVVSVLTTMGLLIGMGFDVHIMSSMIAIFLMPIAVADSVHILSEFFDTYPKYKDKVKTLEHIMSHLFMPMLFTSLTTIAGFASLALTPIPPVRVFGLFVAFGVAMAWVLSVMLVPAYIMVFVTKKSLDRLETPKVVTEEEKGGVLDRFLTGVGGIAVKRGKTVVGLVAALAVIAAWGISLIEVNDNPVLWFTPNHRIREADRVLNHHFGGTYPAYLQYRAAGGDGAVRLPESAPEALRTLAARGASWEDLEAAARESDTERLPDTDALIDEVLYMDPDGLVWTDLPEAVRGHLAQEADVLSGLEGEALQDQVLNQLESLGGERWEETVRTARVNAEAPAFRQPAVLRWIADLQAHIAESERIGKSTSVVDALKKAHLELNRTGSPEDEAVFYTVPDNASATAQVFLQLEGMKKRDSLFHLVTRDYNESILWLQLTSGDNLNMQRAKAEIDGWIDANPPPIPMEFEWAGLTYLNVVWQQRMVGGMLSALLSSFVVVLLMMTFLFRDWKFGLLSMVPLSLTIGLTYGIIGLVGKAYDMPVAVLSSLTLGLSVDFAIHFLQRSRELVREKGSWSAAWPLMFREPARAISRNAIIIAIGFTPLLFAPLVPYRTVGFFLATIMFVSWVATLFILASLITLFQKKLFTP